MSSLFVQTFLRRVTFAKHMHLRQLARCHKQGAGHPLFCQPEAIPKEKKAIPKEKWGNK